MTPSVQFISTERHEDAWRKVRSNVVSMRPELAAVLEQSNAYTFDDKKVIESARWWAVQCGRAQGYREEFLSVPAVWIVPVVEGQQEAGAMFIPADNVIIASSNVPLEEVLVHEFTHAIQRAAGKLLDTDLTSVSNIFADAANRAIVWYEQEAMTSQAMWLVGSLDVNSKEVMGELKKLTDMYISAAADITQQQGLS
jgi:hypothetical protein